MPFPATQGLLTAQLYEKKGAALRLWPSVSKPSGLQPGGFRLWTTAHERETALPFNLIWSRFVKRGLRQQQDQGGERAKRYRREQVAHVLMQSAQVC